MTKWLVSDGLFIRAEFIFLQLKTDITLKFKVVKN